MAVSTNSGTGIFLFLLAGLMASGVWAGETGQPDLPAKGPEQVSDTCGFYRGTAFGKGLTHFATEMLWTCEAIEQRRRAGMRLSAELANAEQRLETYRQAVVKASVSDLGHARQERRIQLGINEAQKYALAESTGALEALAEIRQGF